MSGHQWYAVEFAGFYVLVAVVVLVVCVVGYSVVAGFRRGR